MTIQSKLMTAARASALGALALLGGALPALAATEIQLWHAMGGELGEKVVKIADDFNATQSDYKIVPVYKGNYTETLTAAIAAFRAGEQPAVVQVFEVGTATMMAAKGAVYPVYQLMADAGQAFDPKAYLAPVVGYYADAEGNILSMPFNSSTPVMYYNKTAFKKAGLDPETPPKTWPELAEMAQKVVASGAATCGFTTGWPSWVQLENLSALHNIPFASDDNGFGGLDAKLEVNQPLQVKHIQTLVDWQKDGTFKYGGRRSDGRPLFLSGECAIYMDSSGSYAAIKANAKDFEFGVGMLPYWPDVAGAPQNSIIGGATLWVLKGRPEAEYKGVAAFFTYLSSAEVQAWWHQQTGYLPITYAAYELTESQGFYKANPGTDVAIKQLTLNPPTVNSRGIRLGNFVQIREVIEEELEAAFAGNKTAQQALDSAVARADTLLREFQAANQ